MINKLKLTLIIKKLNLLHLVGYASYFIVFSKILLQTNNITALTKPVAEKSRIFFYFDGVIIVILIKS